VRKTPAVPNNTALQKGPGCPAVAGKVVLCHWHLPQVHGNNTAEHVGPRVVISHLE
jgi:hypothetical protein